MTNWVSWSLRVFAVAGIEVRVHWSLLLMAVTETLRWWQWSPRGEALPYVGYGAALMAGYWLSILLHEFGHCAAARSVGTYADQVLLWPLGGLAFVGRGGSPRKDIWISLAGPLVNFALAAALFGAAALQRQVFQWGMLDPFHGWGAWGERWDARLCVDLARANFFLGACNLCAPVYPLDGGQILRALFAMRMGFERATWLCTTIALVVGGILLVWGIVLQELTLLMFAAFVLYMAWRERALLREGALEGYSQTYLGHDFSMGYTSLERGERRERRRRPGFFARLRQRRAERRAQRRQEEEERLRGRVDQLLEKVSREGIAGLTPEERSYLEEASRRFQEFEARERSPR